MRISEILSEERIVVDCDGSRIVDKETALRELGALLAPSLGVKGSIVYQLLFDREQLQSTGIGEGVAIPHASTDDAATQAAALLLCPRGLAFDSIDGSPVRIVFGVVGPRKATGEHLRTLARISRLLRDAGTRSGLLDCMDAKSALRLALSHDEPS